MYGECVHGIFPKSDLVIQVIQNVKRLNISLADHFLTSMILSFLRHKWA